MKLFANIAYEKSAFINLFFFILFYFRDGVKLAGVDHEGFSKTVPEPKPFACRTTSCAIRVRCIVYHANQTVNHQIEVYKYLPSLVLSSCFSLAFLSILTTQIKKGCPLFLECSSLSESSVACFNIYFLAIIGIPSNHCM